MITRQTVSVMLVLFAVGSACAFSPASAQSARSGAGGWETPRTPEGHPDLQGNWTNATMTPLQRPEGQGPTLSPQVVAQMEGDAQARFEEGLQPSDPDRPAPPVGGDGSTGAAGGVGGYNRIYIDPGYQVAVVDGEYRSSLVTFPEDGRVPELTEEGQAARMASFASRREFGQYDHPETRPFGERCILSFGSSPGPPILPNGFYNNNVTIVQTPDHVMIMSEMVHDVRIIELGEPDPPPSHIRPWFGYSWGRWEGDTLVVETTNIHPRQSLQGVPPSEEMKVIERFTRVGEERILYEFRIEDPARYSEPWGGQIPMQTLGDLLYEYACHEGNYALSNVLSGARYQERQEAEEQSQSERR